MIKLKKWGLVFSLLIVLCVSGCAAIEGGNKSSEIQCNDKESILLLEDEVGENLIDEVSASPETLMGFYSLEDFSSYISSAKSGEDVAKLSALEYFYLPANIPLDYQLYKITAGSLDIAFWYLPVEDTISNDAILSAESQQKHFMFISSRGEYNFESEMSSLGATYEDLVEGKYLIPNYASNLIIWEEDHVVLFMYLPKDYVIEDWNVALSTEKYVRNDDNSFKKANK